MAISIVNGYVCTSSCDAAKARKGEDPHPLTGADKAAIAMQDKASDSSRTDGPAVLFGGSLSGLPATQSVSGTGATSAPEPARKPLIDRLA